MTERRKDGITEGQGESSIAPLFQSGAIIKREFLGTEVNFCIAVLRNCIV